MKNQLIITVLAFFCLTVIPFLSQKGENEAKSTASMLGEAVNTETGEKTDTESAETENTDGDGSVTVFLSGENKTVTVSYFEYTCGSTAAEMPLSYEKEALKAQAVACFTNALRLKSAESADETLLGADISDDTGIHQGYISKEERKEKWGDSFEEYEKKLEDIVKDVENEVITYKGELCTASFFAISSGSTESAQNIWGNRIPYLVSVKSNGDTLSPDYSTVSKYTKDLLEEPLKKLGVSLDGDLDMKKLIEVKKVSDSKTVLSALVCEKEFTGEEIRSAFSLRSPCFSVKCDDSGVTFTVLGYGHGVGLSQYGANYMAKSGSDYKEILKHYYKGVSVEKL